MKTPLICVSALILSCVAHANVVLAPIFTDGAVLQRDKPVPVWGTADAGEKVTVTFAGQSLSTTADNNGKWRVDLSTLAASAEGRPLTVQGNNEITLNDVIVGEVWLASGQSNMEWRVNNSDYGKYEMAFAHNPLIRHYGTKKKTSSTPIATAEGKWVRTTPETVGNFTAVGYYFAADLYRSLGVPVGIINSSWGGTRIEAWMDAAAADKTKGPAFAEIHTRWDKSIADYPAAKTRYEENLKNWEAKRDAAKAEGKPFTDRRPSAPAGAPGNPSEPSCLYNGMIAPHVPYALRGFIWYQGCSNTGRAHEYRDFQTAMITGWRQQFGQGDIPFYWAQLANYRGQGPDKIEYANLRGAQTETLALSNTGQAVIIDIGNVTDIHPRNKHDVGRRLALVALKRTYGKTGLVDSGPVFDTAIREGSAMRVSFKPADIESPLTSPRALTPPGFELAGADKVFYPATAKIDGQTVVVTSDKVPDPVAVRYAWRNAPEAGLFNRDGLPACPFRSDDW